MGEKTAGVGHFQIPTAPAGLTAVTQSGSANTLGSAAVFGNAPAALYITGIHIGAATTQTPTYVLIQILVAASAVGQYIVPYGVSAAAAASVLTGFRSIYPPIPVANAAAITVKSASSVASAVAWGVSLECINQSNVVDDAVAVTLPSIPTNWITAAGINAAALNGKGDWMVSYTQPTGFLAATFPTTVASTTNITAASGVALAASQHVIVDSGTVTTLSNLPAITAGWLTATGIAASALNGKGDWNIGKTGYSLTQAFPTNFSAMALTVGGAVTAGTVSDKTGYSLTQTFPANFSSLAITAGGVVTNADTAAVTAIKAKTDSLTFTVPAVLDAHVLYVDTKSITGSGTLADPWRAP